MIRFQIPLDFYRLTVSLNQSNAAIRSMPSTPAISNIYCSLDPAGAREMDAYARREIIVDYMIWTKYDFENNGGIKLGCVFKDNSTGYLYQIRDVEKYNNSRIRLGRLWQIGAYRFVI